MCLFKTRAAPTVVVGALALVFARNASAVCEEQNQPPVVVRPWQDTRIMQTHATSGDGAAGLIWLKRTSHVRGLVGFDLSCQAAATPSLACAALEVSIYDGSPTLDGSTFAAHRLLVPWLEGNQSFNEFAYAGSKLGPFGGSGPGTNWACRVDAQLSNGNADCSGADRWSGADDCGNGSPCYSAASTTAFFADPDQATLAWDVTESALGASGDASWLLKVADETKKSGGVKFYTRDGARFMAEHEPGPDAEALFDEAPRLMLWGPRFRAPTVTPILPPGNVLRAEALVRIRQQSPTIGGPARWTNLTDGRWGYMSLVGAADWSAAIPLDPGENQLEFTVFDSCGTEGLVRQDLYRIRSGADCGPAGCARAFLCYGARVTRRTRRFEPLYGRALFDEIDAERVDVLEPEGLCLPVDVDGEGIADPDVVGVAYAARAASGAAAYQPALGIRLTDRFGPLVVDTLQVDGVIAPASSGFGFGPAPLADAPGPYKCHRVLTTQSAVGKGTTVRGIDEFENREYALRRPHRVCYPTAQPSGGDQVGPLACYRVKRAFGEGRNRPLRGLLQVADAFGSLALDTRSEEELCVEVVAD